MAVRRRGIRGGLNALGEYGAQQAGDFQSFLLRQVLQKQQQQFAEKQRIDQMAEQDRTRMFEHPELAGQLIKGATAYGRDLSPYAPTDTDVANRLVSKVSTATNPLDVPPNALQALTAAGAKVPSGFGPGQFNLDAQGQNTDVPGSLPSTQYGPTINPDVQRLMDVIKAKEGQFTAEDLSKVKQAGAVAQSTATGTGMGTEAATAANFPAELQRKLAEGQQASGVDVAHQRALNPVLASRAGAESGARERAALSPDIVAGKGKLAGVEATARENAKAPTEKERQLGDYFREASNSNLTAMQLEKHGAGGFGAALPNVVASDINQKYTQAQNQFVDAVIRPRTGAAIGKDELEQYRSMFFRKTGDTDAVMKQKEKARMEAIDGLKLQAGKGAPTLGMPISITPGSTLNKIMGSEP